MNEKLARLRRQYAAEELSEHSVYPDPIEQFRRWLQQAIDADFIEPNAMVLATATPDGKPSARMVLLKSVDEHGFVFFTNYESRKGDELKHNPRASLLFYWDVLGRQVRVEGRVEKTSREESEAYFKTRPFESRIAAVISHQSRVIARRAELEQRFAELEAQYRGKDVPLPLFWGGYRVIPDEFEFWQGRENRLHDRLCYVKGDGGWRIERLSP
jgi:pyridoxamine 5'-phosphate oxidase